MGEMLDDKKFESWRCLNTRILKMPLSLLHYFLARLKFSQQIRCLALLMESYNALI